MLLMRTRVSSKISNQPNKVDLVVSVSVYVLDCLSSAFDSIDSIQFDSIRFIPTTIDVIVNRIIENVSSHHEHKLKYNETRPIFFPWPY